MGYGWSEEDIAFLKENYLKMEHKELATKLNKTVPSVRTKLSKLGWAKLNRWTDEEIQFLKNNFSTASWKYILENLPGRSKTAIENIAKAYGLSRTIAKAHEENEKFKQKSTALLGQTFGRLTVIECLGYKPYGKVKRIYWLCECSCSNKTHVEVPQQKLLEKNGGTKSCGCLAKGLTSARVKDITGQQFGRLVVQNYIESREIQPGKKASFWLCSCSCGGTKEASTDDLTSAKVQSCGCLETENRITHGLHHLPEYKIWASMCQRCYNPKATGYEDYGGRGITVAAEWKESFERFIKDVGQRPGPEYSLDRIDNNLGYFPGNIRWATRKQQQRNMRSNVILTHNGESYSISEWAEKYNMPRGRLTTRLSSGWPLELALTAPKGYQPKDIELNPEYLKRSKAYYELHQAIKKGKLIKPECCQFPSCSETKNIQAHHHNGYEPEHWLDVVWLCVLHHHKANRGLLEVL